MLACLGGAWFDLTSSGHVIGAGRVFESAAGVPILVGRNKRENEQLSLHIGRHPDVWFHAREVPGAHVVLRMSVVAPRKKDGKQPGALQDCVQMAADLVSARTP